MDKLHSFGFDLNTLAWIHSYLTNREQHDVADGSACAFSGVPKAHVLGTHIFLIYNILTTFQLSVSQKEFLNLFADDMHVSL